MMRTLQPASGTIERRTMRHLKPITVGSRLPNTVGEMVDGDHGYIDPMNIMMAGSRPMRIHPDTPLCSTQAEDWYIYVECNLDGVLLDMGEFRRWQQ